MLELKLSLQPDKLVDSSHIRWLIKAGVKLINVEKKADKIIGKDGTDLIRNLNDSVGFNIGIRNIAVKKESASVTVASQIGLESLGAVAEIILRKGSDIKLNTGIKVFKFNLDEKLNKAISRIKIPEKYAELYETMRDERWNVKKFLDSLSEQSKERIVMNLFDMSHAKRHLDKELKQDSGLELKAVDNL